MNSLQRSGYQELFLSALVVLVCFHLLMAVLGLVAAFALPGVFNINGAPAQGPGGALAALAIMMIVFLILDLAIAAVGAGVWVAVRRLLPGNRPEPFHRAFE
jgi:hypothetical protein